MSSIRRKWLISTTLIQLLYKSIKRIKILLRVHDLQTCWSTFMRPRRAPLLWLLIALLVFLLQKLSGNPFSFADSAFQKKNAECIDPQRNRSVPKSMFSSYAQFPGHICIQEISALSAIGRSRPPHSFVVFWDLFTYDPLSCYVGRKLNPADL